MEQRPLSWANIEVERDPDTCYRLLCDIAATPDWVPGVANVTVLEADPHSRVLRAEFVAMPSRASVAYPLRYEYDDESRTVRWRSDDSAERGLVGEARVEVSPSGVSRVVYGLSSSITDLLPSWAQVVLDEDRPEPVVEAFKRWAERSR